jgi:hypothetical protein
LGLALSVSGVANARVVNQDARGVTDDEILVGGLGPAFPFKDFGGEIGAQARFKVENDKGGVFGREITYVGWGDDNNSSDTNLAETRRLVEQEGVFALVPVLTPNYLQAATFAEQQKVPAFGWGIARGFCDTKYAFSFVGCLTPPDPKIASNTWGSLVDEYLKAQGDPKGAKGKTAAIISEDNDSGRSGKIVIVATAKAVGMKIVYDESSVPPPDPAPVADFSPYVNELMTADNGEPPDVIFDLPVKLTKRTASVARNARASVTIKTTKGAECGIDVQYKSGSSTAAGLEPKVANAKGAVTWKWLVAQNASKGRAPIVITCTLGDLSGRLDTAVKVT